MHFTNSILLEKSSEYLFRLLRLLIKGKWHFSVWRPSGAESVLYAAFENLTLMCPDRIWIPNYIIFSPSEEPKTKHFPRAKKYTFLCISPYLISDRIYIGTHFICMFPLGCWWTATYSGTDLILYSFINEISWNRLQLSHKQTWSSLSKNNPSYLCNWT